MDSKYMQQHLANERTYLAWLRTAISVFGLGFLVANLHLAVRKELPALNNKIIIDLSNLEAEKQKGTIIVEVR
ncbi:hypothetical protein bthur0007_58400 [Bacillus thuringiensis serovar monterrey BGSC 4AJ1]|nr:hypothetical protein bthur0007_58400 [Bacillus thuringiensis serovar monterrey BGSC 4AJ1]